MTQANQSTSDRTRQLMDLALSCGRSWQSPQTGYIHYCHEMMDEELHHTMPLYENLLFALALMRSRIAENISEGKQVLESVLNFQNVSDPHCKGNFPFYMHEFPLCRDRFHGIHFLAPLYWIHQHFHHVIGSALKNRLEESMRLLAAYCQPLQAPYHLAVKKAVGVRMIAQMLHDQPLAAAAENDWQQLRNAPDASCWFSPTKMADLLVAYQMVNPKLSDGDEKNFWHHLVQTWHQHSGAYCGPGLAESQRNEEPLPTLYDYFMGYFSGHYHYRLFFDHPIQLQAILVQPSEDHIEDLKFPVEFKGNFEGLSWQLCQHEKWAYSLIEKGAISRELQEKGFAPMKLLWGDATRTRSLMCQGGNVDKMTFTGTQKKVEMFFTLAAEASNESREKSRDISFFVDIEEVMQIHVAGAKATTFQLDESITLSDDKLKITMLFTLHTGSGVFMGHIMKGNRPSQTAAKGQHRFDVFDWQIFLRAIERSAPCIIKVTVEVAEI